MVVLKQSPSSYAEHVMSVNTDEWRLLFYNINANKTLSSDKPLKNHFNG